MPPASAARRVSANDPNPPESAAGGQCPFVEVHGLPSLAGIGQSRQNVDDLKNKLTKLDALVQKGRRDPEFRKEVRGASPPFLEGVEAERGTTIKLLSQGG